MFRRDEQVHKSSQDLHMAPFGTLVGHGGAVQRNESGVLSGPLL
jgi:hypothetical protein